MGETIETIETWGETMEKWVGDHGFRREHVDHGEDVGGDHGDHKEVGWGPWIPWRTC